SSFQAALFPYAVDDLLTLLDSTRGDVDVTQYVVVLSALVRHHLGNPSGTNNQNVSFHYFSSIRLLGLGDHDLRRRRYQSRRSQTRVQAQLLRWGAVRHWIASSHRWTSSSCPWCTRRHR